MRFISITILISILIQYCDQTRNRQVEDYNDLAQNDEIMTLEQDDDKYDLVLNDQCDLITQGQLCINKGRKVFSQMAIPKELSLHYSFDWKDQILDTSGNNINGEGKQISGPSQAGRGSSIHFNKYFIKAVDEHRKLNSKQFSVAFWLFLLPHQQTSYSNNKELRYCPLVQKGIDDKDIGSFHRSPLILLDRKERQIKAVVSTTDLTQSQGESIESNAKIIENRWTHVVLIRSDKAITLYINGQMDGMNNTVGWSINNQDPLFIGSTPIKVSECNFQFYMDEFRFYTRELTEYEIEAETASVFGGVEPSFIQLGCTTCDLGRAFKSCSDSYHLCTSNELSTGAFQFARIQGFVNYQTKIWTNDMVIEESKEEGMVHDLGTGICCSNLI